MAKEPESQDERASPQKPPRRPITIDLPAEEIARKEAAAAPPASKPGEPDTFSRSETPNADVAASGPKSGKDAGAEKGKRPAAGAEIPSAFATGKSGATASSSTHAAASNSSPPKWRPVEEEHSRRLAPFLFAALGAVTVAAIAIVALALTGYFSPPDNSEVTAEVAALKQEVANLQQAQPQQDLAPLHDQIAAVEKSVSELAARAPAEGSDTVLTELQGRLAVLENSTTTNSTAALEERLNQLGEEVATLRNAAPADAPSLESAVAPLRQEIEALSARLDAAPRADRIAAIDTTLEQLGAQIGMASALAPAVAADALAAALQSGRPFSNELAALKSFGANAEAVERLSPHAAAGLPTLAELRSEFAAAIAPVELAPPIPEGTGAIDRLLQSARGLVEVRPVHPTAGSDPGAIVARIRGALDAGDLESALAEWATLPETIRAPTADWAKQVEARMQADDLVATVRAEALSHLGAGE